MSLLITTAQDHPRNTLPKQHAIFTLLMAAHFSIAAPDGITPRQQQGGILIPNKVRTSFAITSLPPY